MPTEGDQRKNNKGQLESFFCGKWVPIVEKATKPDKKGTILTDRNIPVKITIGKLTLTAKADAREFSSGKRGYNFSIDAGQSGSGGGNIFLRV